MKVTFDTVKLTGVRYVIVNGKRKRQQKVFYQTVNPYNRNHDGSVKSRAEVVMSVREEVLNWQKEGASCATAVLN